MRVSRLVRILGFLLLLGAPFVGTFFARGALTNEKRERAPRPTLTWATWKKYPEAFDAWFRDRFGFRDRLIHWHSLVAIKALRESPVPNVIIGGGGRLFYAGYNDGVDIADFAGRHPIAPGELDRYLVHNLERRMQYAALGAHYLIVLVPNKQTVYPEDVPARYGPPRPGLFDATMARLGHRTDLDVLDLRPLMRAHRDDPTFYATDTHWNGNGAFWAAHAIVAQARTWFPSLAPLRREDYDVTTHRHAGDLAAMLAMTDDFDDLAYDYQRRGGSPKRSVPAAANHTIYEQPGSGKPRVLLLGDSFGGELANLLGEAFGRVHYFYSARVGYDPALPAADKPDLVVLVLVERYLPRLADQ